MSPRERFLITLNHEEPDRVPTFTNLILPWKISMPILRLLKNTEPIPLAFNGAASFF